MKLTDSEKRDLINLVENEQFLPEKYRFLLFEKSDQVELIWNGKSNNITNIVLPFQIIEQIDEPRKEQKAFEQGSLIDLDSGRQIKGWTNKLIWGDNKYILSSLKNGPIRDEIQKQGGIKLIYIDPPFDVGADFSMNVDVGDISYEKKPNVLEQIAYRDTWGLGADSFLSMIYERLILMRDLLAEDGSIYVHCDWRLNSSLRLILDEIFGKENFLNEIIWRRRTNTVKAISRKFSTNSDTILFYRKSPKYLFNIQYKDYAEDYLKRFNHEDENGKYRWQVMATFSQKRYDELKSKNRIREKVGGKYPEFKQYLSELKGIPLENIWTDINMINAMGSERIDYPTQKPEELIKRILEASSKESDLICDFFSGSGTTAAVAEKLNRKWICCDLGKFAIHSSRKRLIGVQRELKESDKNWRPFEILNLGKYQRDYFIYDDSYKNIEQRKKKELDFEKLVLDAYKAEKIEGFKTLHAKKANILISIGPINQPLSRNHVEEVIEECTKNNITSVDILGFEYEMGLFPTIQEEAKNKGLRLIYKQIPMDIFDKRAVSNNEVIFHDVAYIDFKVLKNKNNFSVELTDFAVFYSEDNLFLDEKLQKNRSKVVVENGNIIKKLKNKDGLVSQTLITESWTDWIDYWSVDFNYESKKEIVKVLKNGEITEFWTGNYVFENEWQSFRSAKNKEIELKSAEKFIKEKTIKIAVKVVDIFGNDTMKLVEIKN